MFNCRIWGLRGSLQKRYEVMVREKIFEIEVLQWLQMQVTAKWRVRLGVSGSGRMADEGIGREEVQELRGQESGRIIPLVMEMTKNWIGVVLESVIMSQPPSLTKESAECKFRGWWGRPFQGHAEFWGSHLTVAEETVSLQKSGMTQTTQVLLAWAKWWSSVRWSYTEWASSLWIHRYPVVHSSVVRKPP